MESWAGTVTAVSQPWDHRPPNTSRPGMTPGKAQQCQTEDRDNSRDLVEVEGRYKQHRVLFLTRGFGRKIRKVTSRGPRKLPPLGFACPELPAFLALGGFSRLGEHSPGHTRAPRGKLLFTLFHLDNGFSIEVTHFYTFSLAHT